MLRNALTPIASCSRSAATLVRPRTLLSVTGYRSLHTGVPARSPSSVGSTSSSVQTSKDPDHPYLHYHTFTSPSPGRVALSFLPDPPIPLGSKTVLGYLPLGAQGLEDFEQNGTFLELMHSSIRDALAKGVGEVVTFEAKARPVDGYLNINDERAPPPAGRIAETEDIIATVFVRDGTVDAPTYEHLPTYRLITSNGPPMLPKGIDEHLIERLKQVDRDEKEELRGSS